MRRPIFLRPLRKGPLTRDSGDWPRINAKKANVNLVRPKTPNEVEAPTKNKLPPRRRRGQGENMTLKEFQPGTVYRFAFFALIRG